MQLSFSYSVFFFQIFKVSAADVLPAAKDFLLASRRQQFVLGAHVWWGINDCRT